MKKNKSFKRMPIDINQFIKMLLNEKSACYENSNDTYVIYELDIAAWKTYFSSLKAFEDFEKKASWLSQNTWKFLPNNLPFIQLHEYETDYLFKEIFVEKTYSKHNIFLPENACIIDVGANIGLFSLYAKINCPSAKIYAFEPIKASYDVLKANFELYNIGRALNFGVTNVNGQQLFTHYKNSTVFSGKYADSKSDESKIKTIAKNLIQTEFKNLDPKELKAFVDLLTKNRMEAIDEEVNTITLESFIKNNNLSNIDLLKIDAEGSEFEILFGLTEKNWDKIKQLIVEVHPKKNNDIHILTKLIKKHGFEVASLEEHLLSESGLVNIYAKKENCIIINNPNRMSNLFFNELERAFLVYEKQGRESLFISLGEFFDFKNISSNSVSQKKVGKMISLLNFEVLSKSY